VVGIEKEFTWRALDINDEYVLFGISIFRDIRFADLRVYTSGNSRYLISIAERIDHQRGPLFGQNPV